MALNKPGIPVNIPGIGRRHFRILVSDFTGTLSLGGRLTAGVRPALAALAKQLDVYVLTADTFGTVGQALARLPLEIHHLTGPGGNHDRQKRAYVRKFDLCSVVALGNGNLDRLMLQAVARGGGLAIAVDNGEGCAIDAIRNANLFISGAANALALLLNTRRLKATLRS
ncbi:MAG TPA: ATPase P [Patescibacteria group bacterium]|nr:ATPase P [Patescibacteria group bacterium]